MAAEHLQRRTAQEHQVRDGMTGGRGPAQPIESLDDRQGAVRLAAGELKPRLNEPAASLGDRRLQLILSDGRLEDRLCLIQATLVES